jgi:hypothetical protein
VAQRTSFNQPHGEDNMSTSWPCCQPLAQGWCKDK